MYQKEAFLRVSAMGLTCSPSWLPGAENAIETSDSMRSRGYGLKGRTAFSIYHFTRKDKYVLGMMIGLSAIFTGGCIKGAAYASYDPRILLAGFTIQGYAAPVAVSPLLAMLTYLCFAAFCFLPCCWM